MRFEPLLLLASFWLFASLGCDSMQNKEEGRHMRGDEGHSGKVPNPPAEEDDDPSDSSDIGSDTGSGTSGDEAPEGVIHVVVPDFGDEEVTFHKAKPKKKRPKVTPASADIGTKAVSQTQKKAEKLDDELQEVLEEIERGK